MTNIDICTQASKIATAALGEIAVADPLAWWTLTESIVALVERSHAPAARAKPNEEKAGQDANPSESDNRTKVAR